MNRRSYAPLPQLITAYLFPLVAGYRPSHELSFPVLFASRLVAQIFGLISLAVASFCPEPDRLFMSKIRQVAGIELDESSYYPHSLDQAGPSDFQESPIMQHCPSGVLPTMEPATEPPVTRRVNVSQSPFLHAFYSHHPLRLTINTGAERNMMRASLARHIGAKVTKSSQTTLQADGRTPLTVLGETRLPLTRHGRPLTLEALVVKDLDVDILAGTPFMTSNDIAVRPAKREIIIAGCDVASYGCSQSLQTHYAVRACHLLRAPNTNTTICPGEFLEIDALSELLLKDCTLAIEPRMDFSHLKPANTWPQPDIVQSIGTKLRLLNNTTEPLLVRKNDHLRQARLTVLQSPTESSSSQAAERAISQVYCSYHFSC